MNLPRKCTVTSLLALMLGLFMSLAANAEMAGSVTHLSGPLLAKKADGSSKILSQNSIVESGDLLISEKDTYARVKFTDSSEITLRPNTQIRIDAYLFDKTKPEGDSAVFNLLKGGLRALTGLIGKRGNQDSYQLKAPSATIGIRGTDYIAQVIPNTGIGAGAGMSGMSAGDEGVSVGGGEMTLAQAAGGGAGAGGLAPGLYVQVLDGMIHLTNAGGSQNFSAGQFGYTGSFTQPPVVLPANPGIQFTPPPAFSTPTQSGQSSSQKPKTVDCEVR